MMSHSDDAATLGPTTEHLAARGAREAQETLNPPITTESSGVFGSFVVTPELLQSLMDTVGSAASADAVVRTIFIDGSRQEFSAVNEITCRVDPNHGDLSAIEVEAAGVETSILVTLPIDRRDMMSYDVTAPGKNIAAIEDSLRTSLTAFLRWNTPLALPERLLLLWIGPIMICIAAAGLLLGTVVPESWGIPAKGANLLAAAGLYGTGAGFIAGALTMLAAKKVYPWAVFAVCRRGVAESIAMRILHAAVATGITLVTVWGLIRIF